MLAAIENKNRKKYRLVCTKNALSKLSNDVKKLTINPMSRLSLQYHKYRSEHWTVVSGLAKVYLDENIYNLKSGDSIDIPSLSKHYVENVFTTSSKK